jgi:lipopolysaccharide exporter
MYRMLRGLLGSSLRGRLLRGGAVLGMGSVAEQGLRFARNIILARLLAPEAFGTMAIVLSVCSLFQVLTGLGIKEAIVQNPHGAERTFLNAAWWVACLRGLSLYAAACVSAPWIASFYSSPELTGLLRIAFVNVLAQGAMSAGAFVAVKEMRYKRWALIQQGGGIIGITTTIVLAFWLRGVWSLALGYASEGVARCLLSYLISPYRPGLHFDRTHAAGFLRFSGGMFGLPLLMLVYTEGCTFAIGKLCTRRELGIFAMALTLARIPTMFSGQLVDLLMPAFSEIRENQRRVNGAILKITILAVTLGLPASCFIAIFGSEILKAAYGPRYAGGAAALFLLFTNELFSVCSVPIATVYLAVGQPALLRRFSVIRAILICVLIVPAIRGFGIAGAAAVPVIAMLAASVFQLTRLRSLTTISLKSYALVWFRGLLLALPFTLFWAGTAPLFKTARPLPCLGGAAGVTLVIGLIGVLSAWRRPEWRGYLWPFVRRA